MTNADRLRELAEMASKNAVFFEYEAYDLRRIADVIDVQKKTIDELSAEIQRLKG